MKTIAEGRPFTNPYGLALGGHHKVYMADDKGAIFRVEHQDRRGQDDRQGRRRWSIQPASRRGRTASSTSTDYSAGPVTPMT